MKHESELACGHAARLAHIWHNLIQSHYLTGTRKTCNRYIITAKV